MRLAILILILIAAVSLVRWFLSAPREQAELSSTEMVQDPNCETYIPVTEAVTATIAGREHFFCSEQCAEEYRNRHNAV